MKIYVLPPVKRKLQEMSRSVGMTIREARTDAVRMLCGTGRGRAEAALDADVLLSALLGCDRACLFAHGEDVLHESLIRAFFSAVEKRKTGFPIAYITHKKEFFGLPFFVDPSVLIPKADTELLVEKAVSYCAETVCRQSRETAPVLLDLFTGSGCVGVAVLHELRRQGLYVRGVFYDIMSEALTIAAQNAGMLLEDRLFAMTRFVQADLTCGIPFAELKEKADVITANPPYIPSAQAAELLLDGRSEPLAALDGGADGLDILRACVRHIPGVLKQGGKVFVEIDSPAEEQSCAILARAGFADIRVYHDLNECPRVIEGRLR